MIDFIDDLLLGCLFFFCVCICDSILCASIYTKYMLECGFVNTLLDVIYAIIFLVLLIVDYQIFSFWEDC